MRQAPLVPREGGCRKPSKGAEGDGCEEGEEFGLSPVPQEGASQAR